jgi:hypothetical protein
MKYYILLAVFLLLVWYLNKKSSNNHFLKIQNKLDHDYLLIYNVLLSFNFSKEYINRFDIAYDYFCKNPKDYNGTSVINDRHTIGGLEVPSVIHDYDWIFATSLQDLLISNVRYAKALRTLNMNWITAWCFIFTGLNIVALFKSIKYIKNGI